MEIEHVQGSEGATPNNGRTKASFVGKVYSVRYEIPPAIPLITGGSIVKSRKVSFTQAVTGAATAISYSASD